MIETVFNAPDIATLVNAAVSMGYYDATAHKITTAGYIATGGAYFLNMVGQVYQPTGATTVDQFGNTVPVMAALPGVWGRLRHNGDPAKVPTLPANSGITLYHLDPKIGWTSDGVTPAPAYVANIGVIA